MNANEAEFPFAKNVVFETALAVVPNLNNMHVHESDALGGRIFVKCGRSLLSWGENISVTVFEVRDDLTRVKVESASKVGVQSAGLFGEGLLTMGDPTFGKHRKNVELILTALSQELSKVEKPQKKKCPICAEQVQPEAIKCRFCGADLSAKPKVEPAAEPTPDPLYVLVNEQPCGPFSIKELGAMLDRKEIDRDVLCARSGDATWQPLHKVIKS